MATPLTPDQKKKIEENRRLALERRAARLAESKVNVNISQPSSGSANNINVISFYNENKTSSGKSDRNFPLFNKKTCSENSHKAPLGNWKKNQSDPSKGKTWNVSCSSETLTGTVSLISKDRFILEIGFNQKLIDLCKTIPGRAYDANRKGWTFPLNEYDNFKKLTATLAPHVIIGNIPASVLKIFSSSKANDVDYKTIDLSKIDTALVNSLYPFQKEGVQFGISRQGRCMIADDMGLGKTIQALALADYYREEWPLLIVCPSSMRFQWEEEIREHLPRVASHSVFVVTSSKERVERAKILILSYDLMGKQKEALKNYGFRVIIVDECHSLKNCKTKRTKAALELISGCRRVILLSGTPALSRPAELFSQIRAVQPRLFTDMIEFGVRYCEGKQDKFGWNFQGSSHLEELRVILEEKIMIRRLKSDVLSQLPSKIRQVIVIDSEMNNKSMDAFAKKLSQNSMKGNEKRSTLLSYFAETGVAKTTAICKHVEQLLSQNQKFLIFGHHKIVLDAICNVLEANKTYYIRIDGSVGSEERKSVSDQFQEEAGFRVAVLSLKAANTGITLTAARLVVFAELFWNPGELIQAEDRAHRIGQESSVVIQYLIAKRTADDYLWPLIQSKLNVLNQAGLTNSTRLEVDHTHDQDVKSGSAQPKISDFFSEMEDDVDETDLVDLLDQIEGVQSKKIKLA